MLNTTQNLHRILNPWYDSFPCDECVGVENGKISLNYHPLLYAFNQCETTHQWCQWVSRNLTTSYWGLMKVYKSSHLQYLKIRVVDVFPLISVKEPSIYAWKPQGTILKQVSSLEPDIVLKLMGQDELLRGP